MTAGCIKKEKEEKQGKKEKRKKDALCVDLLRSFDLYIDGKWMHTIFMNTVSVVNHFLILTVGSNDFKL